jgi:pyruvate/oxaloacetate carboxyltransferase
VPALIAKNENVNVEDVYTLLVEVHRLLLEQKETLDQVKDVLGKVPEAVEALGSNPMFKPFAKMLGIRE